MVYSTNLASIESENIKDLPTVQSAEVEKRKIRMYFLDGVLWLVKEAT